MRTSLWIVPMLAFACGASAAERKLPPQPKVLYTARQLSDECIVNHERCMAYIAGVVDLWTYSATQGGERRGGSVRCIPQSQAITLEVLRNIVVAYLRQHPEQTSAPYAVMDALAEAYNCP